jgi:hypothetical protein
MTICHTHSSIQDLYWSVIMKSKLFKTLAITAGLVSLSTIFTASAWADEGNWAPEKPFVSTKTVEQVRAEYFQAQKDGTLPQTAEGASIYTVTAPPSTLSREAVVADTIEWLRMTHGDVMMGGN